jgi:catechol 2,3-dioxygenase-like lactoylglutathione lyase family enzyme
MRPAAGPVPQQVERRLAMPAHRDDSRLALLGSYAFAGLLLIGTAAGIAVKVPALLPANSLPALLKPEHLSMTVADVAETVRWYEDKLGFVQVAGIQRDNEAAHALLVRDANFIELIDGGGSNGPVLISRDGLPAITVGRLPLLLDDVDGEISSLREQGVEVIAEPRNAERRSMRVGLIRDINGRTVELRQPF